LPGLQFLPREGRLKQADRREITLIIKARPMAYAGIGLATRLAEKSGAKAA